MAKVLHQDEQTLVARLIAGDKAAAARFAELADQPVWTTIVTLVGDNAEGDQAYRDATQALAAQGFARLKRFDGRTSLNAFLVLEVRNWLAEQTAGLFAHDVDRAWRRLERHYRADFARLAAKHFPKADNAEIKDRLQDLRVRLIEDNCRRIRAYKGDSAFSGYILKVARRLMQDFRRQEMGRLRLPERIARQSALHQAIFRACAWNSISFEVRTLRLALLGQIEPDPTSQEIEAVVKDIASDILAARDALDEGRRAGKPHSLDAEDKGPGWSVPDANTPETIILQTEQEREVAKRLAFALERAKTDLRPLDQACLAVMGDGEGYALAPAEIAALLGEPVDEIYGALARIRRWGKKLDIKSTNNAKAPV